MKTAAKVIATISMIIMVVAMIAGFATDNMDYCVMGFVVGIGFGGILAPTMACHA